MLASRTGRVNYLQRGKRGRVPKMMGVYDPQVHYVCTDDVAPVVLYTVTNSSTGKVTYDYYIMLRNYDWLGADEGTTPPRDAATGAANEKRVWDVFDNLEYVFADLAMIKYGLLAGAVCTEDRADDGTFRYAKMFSQTGRDGSTAYEKFDPGKDAWDNSQKWKPMLCVDWKTGKLYGNEARLEDAYMSGEIIATKGTIGKFNIDEDGLSRTDGVNEVKIHPQKFLMKNGTKYMDESITYSDIRFGEAVNDVLSDKPNLGVMTMARIYRRGYNLSASHYFMPALQVISDNIANRNVSIRAEGGCIVAQSGILNRVQAFNPTTDRYNELDLWNGGDFMIYNDQSRNVVFPDRATFCATLGYTTSTTAAVFIRVVSHPMSTQDFILRFPPDDPGTFYDQNGNKFTEVRMSKGDMFECYLVSEPTMYWAQKINWITK